MFCIGPFFVVSPQNIFSIDFESVEGGEGVWGDRKGERETLMRERHIDS